MSRRKKHIPAGAATPSQSSPPPAARSTLPVKLVAALLAIVTLGLFAPVAGFEFVNYDDPMFITNNRHVPKGFTWDNIVWALRNSDAYLWHPMTWFSHMLDYRLYGLKPAGHHVTNVLLHAGSTVLLFLTLRRMTGTLWRSAAVAALFAWHPLHVQSVAWVAERKDVLSCFFWMLTLWCYARYVERPGAGRYALMTVTFALGLMSKPMVVTLPCVLLLLDIWPLRRINLAALPSRAEVWKLFREKIPLFVLVAAGSLVTLKVMTAVLTPTDRLSLGQRFANSVISYVRYLGDVFWPAKLAVFYPLPDAFPIWQVVGASVLLIAITWVVVYALRREGSLAVGWFWFLGTMVPTIGLIQNGGQAMADRYTYIPYVGAFILIVWAVGAIAQARPKISRLLAGITGGALVACLVLTHLELRHWRNSITLFTHAVASTKDNYVAHYNLAVALDAAGRIPEAVEQYRQAVRAAPEQLEAAQNLAVLLYGMGQVPESITIYEDILRRNPNYAQALVGLGAALDGRGETVKAMELYQRALRAKPDHVAAYIGLGMSMAAQGKPAEAVGYYREALKYSPGLFDAQVGLAGALLDAGNPAESLPYFQAALQQIPNSDGALTGYGIALARLGRMPEAEVVLTKVVQVASNASTHNNLANVLVAGSKYSAAIEHYNLAIAGNPTWVVPVNSLARLLSMAPDPQLRNGPKALELAQRACQATNFENPVFLETLAAAYAENGRFDEAVAAAQKALAIMQAAGQKDAVVTLQHCLELYRNRQPFHLKP
jgi:tetratricopeptide (TPR) repeat protein